MYGLPPCGPFVPNTYLAAQIAHKSLRMPARRQQRRLKPTKRRKSENLRHTKRLCVQSNQPVYNGFHAYTRGL